ncbi:MAG: response regulator [Sphingobacteriaceae bacterium]|nr:response regulator [Sphingobacteriaceae bacterium]
MIKNKILLIDDDHFNSFALLTFLRAKGFECFSATGAREGIEILLKEKEIGIVLMDMIMPDMDGYEATTFIKENATLMHIPVIAVTAQAMEGDKEKCLIAGAEEYVSKPVDIEELMRLLNEYIG